MNVDSLFSKLEAAFGSEKVTQEGLAETSPLALSAVAMVSPKSVAEVVELVRFAESEGCALSPRGGGTHQFTGYPLSPEKPVIVVSLAQFNTITDFQPEDMTITCDPGTTLAQVQTVAATRRLRLGLDVPLPSQATIGGITSTNTAGFMRLSFGTPRDTLIGVRAVMSEGREVRGGGKVVKNVAGYDLCKLYTGAWGTVGILTELTFKLTVVPDVETYLMWQMPDMETATKIGLELHHARLAPLSLIATNEIEGKMGEATLVIGMMGTPARVAWQSSDFARRIEEAGVKSEAQSLSETSLSKLRDRQARLDDIFGVRLSVTLTELPLLTAKSGKLPLAMTAHCGVGTLSIAPAPDTDPAEVFRSLLPLLPKTGNMLWQKVPTYAPEDLSRWGEVREDFALQKLLKASLDPGKLFNPARFIGRL